MDGQVAKVYTTSAFVAAIKDSRPDVGTSPFPPASALFGHFFQRMATALAISLVVGPSRNCAIAVAFFLSLSLFFSFTDVLYLSISIECVGTLHTSRCTMTARTTSSQSRRPTRRSCTRSFVSVDPIRFPRISRVFSRAKRRRLFKPLRHARASVAVSACPCVPRPAHRSFPLSLAIQTPDMNEPQTLRLVVNTFSHTFAATMAARRFKVRG